MGMRQRYLLGKYNEHMFQPYMYNTSRLNTTVWTEGFGVLSTDVYRTLQSGYAQLFGMSKAISGQARLDSGTVP